MNQVEMTHLHRALTIAGTDPSGGAGVMADLKSFQARHTYGMAVITSVVAQNTRGVVSAENVSQDMLKAQLDAVYTDIKPEALKTGMIPNRAMVEAIIPYMTKEIPYVMDPVMVATSGHRLIDEAAIEAIKEGLIPKATLVTPNRMEAEVLANLPIKTEEDVQAAAHYIIHDLGAHAVLIKGGHELRDGSTDSMLATDYLFVGPQLDMHTFTHARYDTPHTHGTGCTLSAVITAELSKGESLITAVELGIRFITEAIRTNPGLGEGHGPVNHLAHID